ncbi:hypothetical protein TKK_0010557 [Trichogramma kaykai]|uniref:Uncharacterized protein n=1 Tax=Trichogramma kaykai TaxID=54128 RepID=A0ABD2WWV4_9HYME
MSRSVYDLVQFDYPKDLSIENARLELLRQMEPLISSWEGQPPNLLDIFRPEEIESLLSDCVKNFLEGDSCYRAFVEFVSRSGYIVVPDLDEDGKPRLRRTTPIHHAPRHPEFPKLTLVVRTLFQMYKCDVNYIDGTGLTHFHVACMSDCEDIVKKFLELGQNPDLLVPALGASPLYLALMYGRKTIAEILLRNGADPTLANSIQRTPLDMVCGGNSVDVDLVKTMLELACEKYLIDPTDQWMNESATLSRIIEKCDNDVLPGIIEETIDERRPALLRVDVRHRERLRTELFHKAVLCGKEKAAELLLRRGVNPRLTDAKGSTALHVVCRGAHHSRTCDENFAKLFFEMCEDSGQTVDIDARDKRGNTPLHVAARYRRDDLVKLLLRVGANPNLANVEGQTPLHFICDMFYDHLLVDIIFEVDDEKQHNKVQIDARDNEGNTPLLLSLQLGNKRVTEVLLRRGADPNIANAMGSTALHLISKDHCYGPGELAKLFFEICDDNRLFVQIDARDESGRTPLQLAVANILPRTVDILLNRGAEMSLFVFPTESYYGARFNSDSNYSTGTKLKMASGALLTIEILETVGYQLSRDDATTIMKFFAKYDLFEKVADIEKPLYDDENLAMRAKTIMVTSSLSFDDLIQLRPEEAEKLLAYEDYYKLAYSEKFSYILAKRYDRAFHALCEKLSKGFFRSWTLDPFWEMIHKRLPLECCEHILAKLNNKDLFNICLAAIMLRHDRERQNNC